MKRQLLCLVGALGSHAAAFCPDVAAQLGAATPVTLEAEMRAASVRTDPEFLRLLYVLYGVESRWNFNAVSPAGAIGIGQVMPATAAEVAQEVGLLGPIDLTTPSTNITLSSAYLDKMLKRFNNNKVAALVAYNAGPSRVTRLETLRSLPEETYRYVTQVLYLDHLCGGV